jgi:YVTN family beta-propeller protein
MKGFSMRFASAMLSAVMCAGIGLGQVRREGGTGGAIPLGGSGQGKTPKPALLVVDKDDSELAIVDPATWKVVKKVKTGPIPHEVAVSEDGTIAITTNYGEKHDGTTMSVIDLAKQEGMGDVTFPGLSGPHGIEIRGDKAYFTIEGEKAVGAFNFVGHSLDLHLMIGEKRPHMLVLSKDGKTIYVSCIDSDTVAIEEMKKKPTDWTATIVKTGKGPEGIDLSPDGKEVWAANSGDGSVAIIDTKAKKLKQTVDVGTKHSNRLKFTPDGKMVLISDLGSGEVVVMEAASRKIVKRLKLGTSTEGILVVPDGSQAIVAVSGDNKLAVVDLKTLEVTTTFETGKDPDGMAWVK